MIRNKWADFDRPRSHAVPITYALARCEGGGGGGSAVRRSKAAASAVRAAQDLLAEARRASLRLSQAYVETW